MSDGRSLDHATLESFRFAAVKLSKRRVSVETIAESFGVTTEAVYIWLKRARTQGLRSLQSSKAPGPEPKLSRRHFEQLLKWLRCPASELGYATDLWSGMRVRHLIKHRLGVVYHAKHMSRLLRRLGLCLKFPERSALEQDLKKVRRWKCYELPRILKEARAKKINNGSN